VRDGNEFQADREGLNLLRGEGEGGEIVNAERPNRIIDLVEREFAEPNEESIVLSAF